MSNPNAIAQVTEAASATDGAGVTLSTDEPTKFPVGLLVELYPSQTRDGSVLTRARSTVGYLVTANPGSGQLTGIINYYDLVDPPQVESGWIIDGRRTASVDNIYDVGRRCWRRPRAHQGRHHANDDADHMADSRQHRTQFGARRGH